MRYVNAAQAARMLGIGDKTIRRWLKEGKKLPGAIVKANGEYAIPENEVEELKQLRDKFATPQKEIAPSHDQSSDITALAAKVAELEQKIATLESKAEKPITPIDEKVIEPPISTPPIEAIVPVAVSQIATTESKKSKRGYTKKKSDLPSGCILASEFAENHGRPGRTFRDDMLIGLGDGLIHGPDVPEDGTVLVKDYVKSEERNKRVRKDGTIEKERYLTADQQKSALLFWKRHGVDYIVCNDIACWCHTVKNGE